MTPSILKAVVLMGVLALSALIPSLFSAPAQALDQYGRCSQEKPGYTMVGVTARTIPSPGTALVGRVWIDITVSKENTGTRLVKCNCDGTTPVMGTGTIDAGNPGDVAGVGDIIRCNVSALVTPKCISDTASTMLTLVECS